MGDGNRALGAKRRPLNPPGSRKFIPPLLNRSSDDTDRLVCVNDYTLHDINLLNSNNYGGNTTTTNNEPVDPRLRNIEPRMIEMIENEVITIIVIMLIEYTLTYNIDYGSRSTNTRG